MSKKSDARVKKQEERSILINFVLDKSGSMGAIQSATISGFNEFLADQQREGGRALVTLTLFDTRFMTVAEAVPASEVVALDHETYCPGGMTALYDAIGHTMKMTDSFVAVHKPDQVLFVVMTDGEENSSREFSHQRIFEMIAERQEKAGYEFLYLGANQDSYAVSTGMGMRAGRSLDYSHTEDAARATMRRASHNVRAYRRQGTQTVADDQFFSAVFEKQGEVEYEDHKRKQKGA